MTTHRPQGAAGDDGVDEETRDVATAVRPFRAPAAHTKLSSRELEVFVRLALGLRNSDISRELEIDQRTVSTYRRRILEKLSLSNDSELVRYAVRHGFLGVDPAAVDAVSIGTTMEETASRAPLTPDSLSFVGRDFVGLWESFMNGSDVALTAIDLGGRMTHWSSYAETLYGWSRNEAIGQPIGRLTMNAAAITPAAADAMVALQQRRAWEGKIVASCRDGSMLEVYVLHVGIVDDEGRLVGMCGLSVRADDPRLRSVDSGSALVDGLPIPGRSSTP